MTGIEHSRRRLVHVLRNNAVSIMACLREMESLLSAMSDAVRQFEEGISADHPGKEIRPGNRGSRTDP